MGQVLFLILKYVLCTMYFTTLNVGFMLCLEL